MPIEFIDDAEDGEDADNEPSAPPPRRSVLFRVAAAAIVVVAVVVWALTRPDDNTAPTATKPTSVQSTFVRRSPTPVPDTRSCQLDAPVMIPIATAMKRFLPALDLADLAAFRCVRGAGIDGRVVFEAISGRYHRLNIDVEAALRTDGSPVMSPSLGSDGGRKVLVAQIEVLAAGLKVDVNAWGKRGDRAPIDAMRDLADFVSLNVVL
jgi:hypothetical protein